jgi:hypothetical protein
MSFIDHTVNIEGKSISLWVEPLYTCNPFVFCRLYGGRRYYHGDETRDLLLKYPHLIPEEWKDKCIYFLGEMISSERSPASTIKIIVGLHGR